MEALGALGIAREIAGKRRDRVFAYDRYIAIRKAEPARTRDALGV
jgi:hypothetical protein